VVSESETPALSDGSEVFTPAQFDEIPLLTVLRDTLGDANRDNDILREVWVHTYVRPKLVQRAAALIPFLYKGMRVEPRTALTGSPRAIINLSETEQPVWQRLFISGVTNAALGHPLVKASVHNYQRNISDYRKSNVMRALTILSVYASQLESDSPLSEAELVQMKSELGLAEKTFGGLVERIHLRSFHEKEAAELSDTRGHNWELLRQQAEASGLYFEPLSLSEQTVTHALIWFPAETPPNNTLRTDRPFEGRFLNIKNPWRDQRLARWQGYAETKYFDSENRLLSDANAFEQDDGQNRRAVKMIPLALYGLDFKKIPALLIDFRNPANPRRRELSGRLINDITRDVLSLSKFGNVYYFLGRSAFDLVTSRRGIDVNQPSRLRSAAELRLFLSFNANISNGLRAELNKGLENLSVNPLENGSKAEREIALAQYRALQAYASRPDGLPAQLQRQRESEAAKFMHHGWDGKLMRLANVLTLGRYTHREKLTPELWQRLDKERQLAYHIRFLREVARSSPVVEVAWDLEKVLPSLRYVAENGTGKDKAAAKAMGSIFSRTEDVQARDLCLLALKRIGNKEARGEMSRIYEDANVPDHWRAACAEYLRIEQPQQSKTVEVSVGSQLNLSQRP